ncbi:hypothetical protein PR048_004818 [Dryococelus australis]|uniref:Uncharacterized protein n=1 Tax=Dryococelus australis TaxID=614101 RepID=A0ABQ9I8J6_9NEOP|nr:hypothetical protein PR048_004818 [Dryococelus australis]
MRGANQVDRRLRHGVKGGKRRCKHSGRICARHENTRQDDPIIAGALRLGVHIDPPTIIGTKQLLWRAPGGETGDGAEDRAPGECRSNPPGPDSSPQHTDTGPPEPFLRVRNTNSRKRSNMVTVMGFQAGHYQYTQVA